MMQEVIRTSDGQTVLIVRASLLRLFRDCSLDERINRRAEVRAQEWVTAVTTAWELWQSRRLNAMMLEAIRDA